MAHPVEQKVTRVRRQARRLLTLYAFSRTTTLALGGVLLLGIADYWIRFQDPGIRLMGSLAIVGVLAWALYRYWLLGWSQPLSDVQVAQRIERHFPNLCDRLSSTIEFLKQPEPDAQAGSAMLRRVVIHDTASLVESLDFSEVLEKRPTRRALWIAAGFALLAFAIAFTAPESTRIALARMVRPLGNQAWPRYYSVVFREAPTRLAVGQPFEVELLNDSEHPLPDEARIFYRYDTVGAEDAGDSQPMQLLNGTLVARKERVARPFWYRAEGGDDRSMDWIRLEVMEPPKLDDLQITLHPPAYSGLPVESSERNIAALRGTRVALAGSSTKRLRRAAVRLESGEELTAAISSDSYHFVLPAEAASPFVVDTSGAYWIELQDVEGLTGGAADRWDLRAIVDQVPTVTIEEPAGNIFVTARGEVPLRIAVKDDMALQQISLHFSRSDRTDVEDFVIPLYEGAQRSNPPQAPGALLGGQLAESRVVEHRWSLADLQLPAGSQLTVWATATDYLPQSGKSTARRISVITPAELEERLAQRQTLVFGELQRVLKLQQDTRAQTHALDIQLSKVGRLHKPDVDQAQSAELNQRQVRRTLTSLGEGIPGQIAEFLSDLRNNQVDSPDLESQMMSISAELERLEKEHLNDVERQLTNLIKAAQASLADQGASGKADAMQLTALAAAGQNQDEVVRSLERMLSELGQWDNYRRFAREIAQLQQSQGEITAATKALGEKTLGRDQKDLDSQQQADLKKLSSAQIELSRRLEKTQQQMAEMSESLKQSDPLSGAAIADGLHQAQQRGISNQMRTSSRQLEQNQLGQAAQQQARIAKDLDDLLATLSNRREQQLSRLVEQLRDAERELARLTQQQRGLRKQIKSLAEAKPSAAERKTQLERLTHKQKALEEEAGRLARRLERLQAEKAGRSMSDAADRMRQVQAAGEQGDDQAADNDSVAAEKDLDDAQQQLAERRRQAEEDLAREQIARLEDSLKSLHERQKKLMQETQRLENVRATEGRLTRAQLSTVNELSRQQQSLEVETMQMAERLALTEVLQLALAGAARQMIKAAELLGHRETGNATQGLQESARLRLAQLIAALAKDQGSKTPSQQAQEGTGQGGGKQGHDEGHRVLAQLKLLKLLQEDLNQRFRTAKTDAKDATGRELAEIATEQGKLASLAARLAEPPEANPEDDPEKLPDIRQDEAGPDALPAADAPKLEVEQVP